MLDAANWQRFDTLLTVLEWKCHFLGRKMSRINEKITEAARLLSLGKTVVEVASDLGISERTLHRWKSTKGFQEFLNQIQSETVKRTVEKVAEKISEDLSDISLEHHAAYKIYRDLATIFGKETLRVVQENPLDLKCSITSLNYWNLILDRSIQGERRILGLEYEDVNKAIQFLKNLGYEIVDPTQQSS